MSNPIKPSEIIRTLTAEFTAQNVALDTFNSVTDQLHKLIMGDELSQAEKTQLQTALPDMSIDKLKELLSIRHTREGATNTKYDADPFGSADTAAKKKAKAENSQEELKEATNRLERLCAILGVDPKDTSIHKKLETLSQLAAKAGDDSFKQSSITSLRADLKSTKGGDATKAKINFLKALSIDGLEPDAIDDSILEDLDRLTNPNPEVLPSAVPTNENDLKAWTEYFRNVNETLASPEDKARAAQLLQSLESPAALKPEDVTALEAHLKLVKRVDLNAKTIAVALNGTKTKDNPITIYLKNAAVPATDPATDPATTIQQKIMTALADEPTRRVYGRALAKLSSQPNLDLTDPDLRKVMEGLQLSTDKTPLQGKNADEQRQFLQQLLNQVRDSYKETNSQVVPALFQNGLQAHEFTERATERIEGLSEHLFDPRREPAKRANLHNDLTRFMSSGELRHGSAFTDTAQALDYFSRGNGDPRIQLAFAQSLLKPGGLISNMFVAPSNAPADWKAPSLEEAAKRLQSATLMQEAGTEALVDKSREAIPARRISKQFVATADTRIEDEPLLKSLGVTKLIDVQLRVQPKSKGDNEWQLIPDSVPKNLKDLLMTLYPETYMQVLENAIERDNEGVPVARREFEEKETEIPIKIDLSKLYDSIATRIETIENAYTSSTDNQKSKIDDVIKTRQELISKFDTLKIPFYETYNSPAVYSQARYKHELLSFMQNLELYITHFAANINPYVDENGHTDEAKANSPIFGLKEHTPLPAVKK